MFKWLVKKFEVVKKDPVPSDGAVAAEMGFGFDDNPYRNPSADYSIWRDDWLFAKGRFR